MSAAIKSASAERVSDSVLQLAVQIVASFVRHNPVPVSELPGLIKAVYGALRALAVASPSDAADAPKPAVAIRKSVTPDYIVCLEDGKKLKMLKRYLRSRFNGMTPDQYRARWNLPPDYPMVAPNYAALRSAFAKRIGLGHKPARTRQRRRVAA